MPDPHSSSDHKPKRDGIRKKLRTVISTASWLEGVRLNLFGGSIREMTAYLKSMNKK